MFLPLQVRLTYDRPVTSLRQRHGAPCPPVTCPVLRDLALCLVLFLGLVASLPRCGLSLLMVGAKRGVGPGVVHFVLSRPCCFVHFEYTLNPSYKPPP